MNERNAEIWAEHRLLGAEVEEAERLMPAAMEFFRKLVDVAYPVEQAVLDEARFQVIELLDANPEAVERFRWIP